MEERQVMGTLPPPPVSRTGRADIRIRKFPDPGNHDELPPQHPEASQETSLRVKAAMIMAVAQPTPLST